MNTIEILRSARALITDREDFWQNDTLTPNGEVGSYCSVTAIGSVTRDAGVKDGPLWMESLFALARAIDADTDAYRPPTTPIIAFNDSRTHAEVLAAFDRAIAVEEAKQQEFTVAPIRDEAIA